jgi:hypothetical protein
MASIKSEAFKHVNESRKKERYDRQPRINLKYSIEIKEFCTKVNNTQTSRDKPI